MQYMVMIYHDKTQRAQMLEAQNSEIVRESDDFAQSLVKSGYFRAGSRLQPTSMAITDGPFAETKEQIAGYLLVECQDLDEAISIAARFPSIRFGASIELRPVIPAC
jgi:hypothetical protein